MGFEDCLTNNILCPELQGAVAVALTTVHTHPAHIDGDGYPRCSVCGMRLVSHVTMLGRERYIPCCCSCDTARIDAEIEERERRQKALQAARRAGQVIASAAAYAAMDFARDDRRDAQHSDLLTRWAQDWEQQSAEGRGLTLFGAPGTGKTYAGACVVNAVKTAHPCTSTYIVSLPVLIDALRDDARARDTLALLQDIDLLMIDDVGTEAQTSYSQQRVWQVVDARYTARRSTIYTTNLTFGQLRNCQNVEYQRIYDRMNERNLLVKFEQNRRRGLMRTLAQDGQKYKEEQN